MSVVSLLRPASGTAPGLWMTYSVSHDHESQCRHDERTVLGERIPDDDFTAALIDSRYSEAADEYTVGVSSKKMPLMTRSGSLAVQPE